MFADFEILILCLCNKKTTLVLKQKLAKKKKIVVHYYVSNHVWCFKKKGFKIDKIISLALQFKCMAFLSYNLHKVKIKSTNIS